MRIMAGGVIHPIAYIVGWMLVACLCVGADDPVYDVNQLSEWDRRFFDCHTVSNACLDRNYVIVKTDVDRSHLTTGEFKLPIGTNHDVSEWFPTMIYCGGHKTAHYTIDLGDGENGDRYIHGNQALPLTVRTKMPDSELELPFVRDPVFEEESDGVVLLADYMGK
jgi:hypothetical protein